MAETELEPAVGLEPTVSALPARQLPGAETGIRTRDLYFTKVLLYQLSYFGNRRLAGGRKHCFTIKLRWRKFGAGSGNRSPVKIC